MSFPTLIIAGRVIVNPMMNPMIASPPPNPYVRPGPELMPRQFTRINSVELINAWAYNGHLS